MTVFFSWQFWRPTRSDPVQISLLHFSEIYEKLEPYYQQWPLVFIRFLGSLEWIWLSLSWSSDVLYWLRCWIFIWLGIAGPHSGTLAWRLPWTEEPGRLQSMGSLKVGHGWVTSLSLFTFMHWRRKWQPTPVFLPGESQGRGSLVGCRLWGHTESDTTEVT